MTGERTESLVVTSLVHALTLLPAIIGGSFRSLPPLIGDVKVSL
ncbi:hypothetical protein [Nonomuraea insulae]|uniref:Uncharacterized protein n=1 Tax=Nonomuraea insulae TaxID=1616787 RepID=A0ABW1D851_9ACTN